jgi:hypothetical protein
MDGIERAAPDRRTARFDRASPATRAGVGDGRDAIRFATIAAASARARAPGPDRPARAALPSPRNLDARVAIPVPMRGAPAESIRGASRDVRVWHVPAGDVGAGNDGADSRGGHGDGRHFQRVCACKDGDA